MQVIVPERLADAADVARGGAGRNVSAPRPRGRSAR